MKKVLLALLPLPFLIFLLKIDHTVSEQEKEEFTPTGRFAFEQARLADPRTGEIPYAIRQKELEYAKKLPKARETNDKSGSQEFVHIGPYNVGGRTRALAFDVSDPFTYFAGGVSGGLWRTRNEGQTWKRVTAPNDHSAVSCIAQDVRVGKTDTWYYGSGESIGNSASKSFSAYYRGSGMYKSTNGGTTWELLESTETMVNDSTKWDFIFNVATDPSRNDSDIVYAAIKTGIMRSKDGGESWDLVLRAAGFHADWTNVRVTSTGVVYATISSDANAGAGFFRSPDGLNWTRIRPPGLPSVYGRTVFDIYRGDEDILFFYTNTINAGANGLSLWKYEYLSGDGSGSGGDWTNLTAQTPDTNMNPFDGYCMTVKVKPDDPDVIFIGTNNLYRSLTGFRDTINVKQVGGYAVFWDSTYNTRTGRQHPDQQAMAFHPNNGDVMLSSTDGGVHRTMKSADTLIQWESLNNGYYTTQFYAIGIDHGTVGSNVVLGGLQDQGTYWTNSSDPNADWVSIRGADGAYVAVEDGEGAYYLSTQYANIRKYKLDSLGGKTLDKKVMPPSLPKGRGHGWLFVHPFTLDPVDNNIMYLPYYGEVWRNDNLSAADTGNLDSWEKIEDVGGRITTISASEEFQGSVFVGTIDGRIYRIGNAHTPGTKTAELISTNIPANGYASCIAVDPNDNQHLIVVFSNYNILSLWHTENGGITWETIEGNLLGDPDPGFPSQFYFRGNGPSIRWAEIIPTPTGNRYFLGTSIGLFSTNELNGDSTIWMQEGAESIGNVVVDMLDYRQSDYFMAVGTHGKGIYTTTVIPNFLGVDKNVEIQSELQLFPNPARDYIALSGLTEASNYRLFDHSGKLVDSGILSPQQNRLNVGNHPAGMYILNVGDESRKIVVSD